MPDKPPPQSSIILYRTADGRTRIPPYRFENETLWLTQKLMAELFQTTKQNVSLHIHNIYKEREVERTATVKETLTVQREKTQAP